MSRTGTEDRSGPPAASSLQVERRQTRRAESGPESLSERIRSQFAPMYLTLVSIVQGAVLTTLVARVEGTYGSFTAVDWILTATTFLALVALWHEYLMQVLAYVWLPTYLDSLIPFGFLVAELVMAHFVYHALRAWLVAYAGFYLMGLLGWYYQNRQIVTLGDDESRSSIACCNRWIGSAGPCSWPLCSSAWSRQACTMRCGSVRCSFPWRSVRQ